MIKAEKIGAYSIPFIKCSSTVTQATYIAEVRRWQRFGEKKGQLKPTNQCRNQACVRIDGRPYCKKHGSMVALDILLGDYDEH